MAAVFRTACEQCAVDRFLYIMGHEYIHRKRSKWVLGVGYGSMRVKLELCKMSLYRWFAMLLRLEDGISQSSIYVEL